MRELRECLEELLSLAKRQQEVLKQEDIDEFQVIGDQREQIITEIKQLNLRPEQIKAEDKQLFNQLAFIDEINNRELNRQFEVVKAELRNLKNYNRRDMRYMDQYSSFQSGRYFDVQEGR